jgi:sugar phosphate isomerase/epimerase
MKTSLFTVSFAGGWGQHRLTLEESIEKTAALGYQGVMVMGKRPHLSPLDYTLDDCGRLRELIESNGLEVACIAAYTNFTGGMESPEVPFVDLQVAYVEALAQRAQALGSDLIRIFTSYERDGVPFAQQWQLTVDAVRECCNRAGEYGVRIGIQNHHDIGVPTKSLYHMIEEIDRPNLVAMYDCWSVFLQGEDIVSNVRKMAPRIGFTTVADYITLPRARYRADLVNYQAGTPAAVQAVPMGQGELPYEQFFTALKQEGFDGWVSYEMCSPVRGGGSPENLERYGREFLKYMRDYG